MKVVWLGTARDDRRRIFGYLAERNPAAAARLVEALILAADGLASFPWRGRRGLAPGTHELVAASPYLLVYEVDEATEVVSILRVWHSAQNR